MRGDEVKKSKIFILVYYLFYAILCGGIVLSIFLPQLYDIFSTVQIVFLDHSLIYKIAFYSCYIISLGIILELLLMFKTIYKETPFKKEVEVKLKVIAVLFELLAIIIGVKSIFMPTLLTLAIFIITFMVGLCFYVLAEVFQTAIAYKNEIDYTV